MSNKTGFISLGLLAVLCSQAFAQSSDGSGIGLTGERKPGSINANGVFITPTVDVLVGNNNNVASAPAGVAKISSTVVSLRPGIVADIERRGDKYQASYFGQFDRYTSSSADNIDNHDVRVTGQNYLSPRLDVNWGLRYVDQFDPRGVNAFVAVPEPIHHRTTELKARGGYGAEGAPGRLELYTGAASKKHVNGKPLSESYNLDTVTVGATFYYRVAPKTRLLTDVSVSDFNYPDGGSTLGNKETKLLVGATWDFLAATSGTVKAGRYSKKADNSAALRDSSGLSLEGIVNWKPLTYTEVIAQVSRGASEAAIGSPGFAITTGAGLTWKHAWRSYINSMISVNQQNADFTGTNRTDKTKGLNASVMYDLTRNIGLGVELGYTKKDSSDPLFSYDQRKVMFKVAASL